MADDTRTPTQMLLWGETQVGKTTLLATGLLAHPSRLPAVDWKGSIGLGRGDTALDPEELSQFYDRLRRNRMTMKTLQPGDLTLRFVGGQTLTIRDIRGNMSRNPFNDEARFLDPAYRGVLFVVEWPGTSVAEHMLVIESALRLCRDRLLGMAITKCERGLDADDGHWLAPPGWWRQHPCWGPYSIILDAFGDRVWPTSAYGFDAEGRPACLLGEFGQVIPYGVAPRNVEAPFRWFFKELGLC